MIERRKLPLLLAAPALISSARAQMPADYHWRVRRDGTTIGTHDVTFSPRGDERLAISELVVAPSFLGVVVYRFEHRYAEVTRRGRFVSVRSRLIRNGRMVEVEAEAMPQGVTLVGSEGPQLLPRDAAPLSWWEPQRFGGAVPIFGTTTGRLMDLRWTREALPGGVRWRTTGEVEATLEFDSAGRWTAYQVKGDDGHMVVYEAV